MFSNRSFPTLTHKMSHLLGFKNALHPGQIGVLVKDKPKKTPK